MIGTDIAPGEFPSSYSRGISPENIAWTLPWLLRLGVFMEFVGHGACGVITKKGWLPYFHVLGISDSLGWKLMPVVGSLDITLGIIALLSPRRALLLYMAVWGCITALLRPAAGEGIWEFIERSYNYGVPFLLLLWYGFGRNPRGWFEALNQTTPTLSSRDARRLLWIVRLIIALMLIGHGGFGAFMGKKNLLGFYQAAGFSFFELPLETLRTGIGIFEIGLGLTALFAAWPAFFGFIFAWKLGSELLYPVAGAPLACWEVVERGGSYVAPIVALLLLWLVRSSPQTTRLRS
ncbi:MAG: hypothetical protein M3Y80_03230 [Verrucomicrobiota bacterium]|nr:hypothetical protein [Verrucomicrobiota bacterium]